MQPGYESVKKWWEIYTFEVRYQLRRPLFYISSIGFFLIATALMASPAATAIQLLGGNVERNAPALVYVFTAVFSIIGLFVVTAFVTNSVLRDFEHGTFPFFFTRPISRFDYLIGRFAGSMTVSAGLFLAVSAGMFTAQFIPGQDLANIGPYRLWPYVASWILIALPNLLVMGACLFAIAIWKRKVIWTYLFVVVYMLLQDVVESIAGRMNNTLLASVLEPTGLGAINSITRYWSGTEMNQMMPAFSGEILLNRLLWLGMASCVFIWACWRFSYTQAASGTKPQTLKPEVNSKTDLPDSKRLYITDGSMPKARQSFSIKTSFHQWLGQTRLELRGVITGTPFIILLLLSLVFAFTFAWFVGQNRETPVWPLTQLMLRAIEMSMGTFLTMTLIFYGGELLWRERLLRVSDVNDALPVSNHLFLLSKLSTLISIATIFLASGIVATVLAQVIRGYSNFEPVLYATGFLALLWPYALLAVLVLFIQVLAGNKYLGYLLAILLVIYRKAVPAIGLEHHLFSFGSHPSLPYSDMNGYGAYAEPFLWYNAFWTIAAIALLMAASLLWVRGTTVSTSARLALAGSLWRGNIRRGSVVVFLALVVCGGWIVYNTVFLNEFLSRKTHREQAVSYEQKYRHYESFPLPDISVVKTEIDLYPDTRSANISGSYILVNRHDKPIRELPITIKPMVFGGDILPFHGPLILKNIDLPPHQLKVSDEQLGFRVYELDQALEPGQSMELNFELSIMPTGFRQKGIDQRFVDNGTFFANRNVFPALGYQPGREIHSPSVRRKMGLPKPRESRPINDPVAWQNNYLEANWVSYETTISTSSDQLAIAPGRLEREWQEGDRNHYQYRTDAPIVDLTVFMSGQYEVARDRWGDVDLEIFYHPGHDWNIDRMMQAAKSTLEYATVEFSPYPHSQLRIVEVPNYIGLTAMSLGGTIPFSESWGFTAQIKGDALDSVTKVVAHEVAHQWWNHQVVPANTQGANFIAETMSEYTALMVLEKETSKADMQRHLRHELDRYFKGRNREEFKENPLNLVGNQPYLHYSKGNLAMYRIRDLVGEQALNQVLSQFIEKYKFAGAPYPTSRELIENIRSVVPAEFQQQLTDILEDIVLFDLRVTAANSRQTSQGRYALNLDFESRKSRMEEHGDETDIPINDSIDIVVFGLDETGGETIIHEQTRLVSSTTNVVQIELDTQPSRVQLDPYFKLIDRVPDDNSRDVNQTIDPN
jgi:ABC-2 type transport system permease protein